MSVRASSVTVCCSRTAMGTTLIANNSLECSKLFDVASLSIQIQPCEVVSFVYISVKVPATGGRHPMRRG